MCFADSLSLKVDLFKRELDVSWLENGCCGESHRSAGGERFKVQGKM